MTVKGLDRLGRKLTKTIPERVLVRVREAMKRSAGEAVAIIRSLAPEDSGALKDSIGWTWGDAPKGTIAIMTSKRSTGGMRITIYAGGDDAYYARFVEFGTAPHANKGKFAGTQNPGMPPQPFFYPGWRLVSRKAKRRVTGAIRKAIKEGSA